MQEVIKKHLLQDIELLYWNQEKEKIMDKDTKKIIEVDEVTHRTLKIWSVEQDKTIGQIVEGLVGKEILKEKRGADKVSTD